MEFLLDTNVLSEAVKKTPNKNVLAMMERYQNQISTAAPVWHELKYGCLRLPRSRKRSTIEKFLDDVVLPNIPVLAYDQSNISINYGRKLKKCGTKGVNCTMNTMYEIQYTASTHSRRTELVSDTAVT
jgi:predicted nucleic acid-binding protein